MLLVAILATGCGGGSAGSGNCTVGNPAGCGGSLPPPTGSGTPPAADPAAKVTSVSVVTSSADLPSSGLPGTEVTVTALLKTADNVGVAGAKVDFAADSGFLSVANATSDASGKAVAVLGTGGSSQNRLINVSVKVGNQAASVNVNVSGTHLAFNAPAVLAVGSSASATATLLDSANRPVSGAPVTASAKNGNKITLLSTQTDSQGVIPVQLTGTALGSEEFTVASRGTTVTRSVTVTGNNLVLSPAIGTDASGAELLTQVPIGTCTPIDASSATAASGSITLATSRGVLYSDSACTQALSGATSYSGTSLPRAWLMSSSAGIATIEGALSSGARASTRLEFVAPLVASARVDVQADQALVGSGESSTLIAVVRDGTAANNLVKGATVQFSILADPSGGALLSPLTAVTGSDGVARAVFVAGSMSGGTGATVIQARLVDMPTVSGAASLTVNKQALSIQFGTGNKLVPYTNAVLQQDFAVFVSDNTGNPVKDVTISPSAWALTYIKGGYHWKSQTDTSLEPGIYAGAPTVICRNEDVQRRGVYDRALDTNGNGVLDPGVPLSVTVSGKTDAMGLATVSLRYPADRAGWNQVELTVTGTVAGTESRARSVVMLLGIVSDYTVFAVRPPGYISPYGTSASCNDSN
jgi:hypothetical protein